MTTTTKDEGRQIAETILSQFGGTRRLSMMAGARDFMFDSEARSVSFKIGRNAKGCNYCRVTLTDLDLYTVEFKKIGRAPKHTITDLDTTENAYADMLVSLFEKATGMYLTF